MPNNVSGLVVNTLIDSSKSLIFKLNSAPCDLPIQFFCIALTFAGQSPISLSPSSNSSAYSEILKNHWFKFFCSTTESHLSHSPSITCSFARTVLQELHQLTGASFL